MIKHALPFIAVFFVSTGAYAASAKCSARATSIYYSTLTSDKELTEHRGTKGKISYSEINYLNTLIKSCEKGLADPGAKRNDLWRDTYNNVRRYGMNENDARRYASVIVDMYSYGASLH